MAAHTLTALQVQRVLAGENVEVTRQGTTYLISLGLLNYARELFQSGQPVEILVPIVGDGMELIEVKR